MKSAIHENWTPLTSLLAAGVRLAGAWPPVQCLRKYQAYNIYKAAQHISPPLVSVLFQNISQNILSTQQHPPPVFWHWPNYQQSLLTAQRSKLFLWGARFIRKKGQKMVWLLYNLYSVLHYREVLHHALDTTTRLGLWIGGTFHETRNNKKELLVDWVCSCISWTDQFQNRDENVAWRLKTTDRFAAQLRHHYLRHTKPRLTGVISLHFSLRSVTLVIARNNLFSWIFKQRYHTYHIT